MNTIGMIGSMSWESTLEYYRIINEAVKERLGGLHSARCILYSLEFGEIEKLQHEGNWDRLAELMTDAADKIETAGADCLIICTNTMHKLAERVEKNIGIPLLHILDATAEAILEKGIETIGLLGTKFTMEHDFYRGRLEAKHGLEVLIPGDEDRDTIHRILYRELCMGEIKRLSRDKFREIIARLVSKGAKGIILGCTEIPLLVEQKDYDIPLFDTTKLHALAAVDYALQR